MISRLPKEPARDYALRFLKHNILSLHLAPGSMISTTEISDMTGISRTPVREAMQELENSGILEIFPQAGSRISYIDYSVIHEASDIRLLLETSVVSQACEIGLGPEWETRFLDNLERQRRILDKDDAPGFMELDLEFHRLLYETTNRLFTYQTLESCMWHFNRLRTLSFNAVSVGKFHADHAGIFDAVKTGDKAAAKKLVLRHLTRYLKDEPVIRAKYPHYFSDRPRR